MKITNFVKTAAGDYVMVDTCFTWDAGLETIAFLASLIKEE